MTISAYQVDNVIKAYHKQIRLHQRASQGQKRDERTIDVLSLSGAAKEDFYQKISYTLKDIMLKDRL